MKTRLPHEEGEYSAKSKMPLLLVILHKPCTCPMRILSGILHGAGIRHVRQLFGTYIGVALFKILMKKGEIFTNGTGWKILGAVFDFVIVFNLLHCPAFS